MVPRPLRVMLVCLGAVSFAMSQPATSALQDAVSSAMAGHRGTAVVVDVHSAKVVAAYRLDVAARRVVRPGSSIKPFTLMALLAADKVTASTALMCKRTVSIAGRELDCSHPITGQAFDPATALAYSCNSYFTTVAVRLTGTQLSESFAAEGFTSVTGLALTEVTGRIATAHSPEQLQLQAIGESGIAVTPLELLQAYRKLALQATNHEVKFDPVFEGLQQSVEYGMGRLAQPATGMKVAGKTGTAMASEGRWTHAWFAGYAPADHPQVALVVFLEKGRGGSDAAVIAREIFAAYSDTHRALLDGRTAGHTP